MKTLTNITSTVCDVKRYRDSKDLSSWVGNLGLDGLEVSVSDWDDDPNGVITPEIAVGVHLPYLNEWMSVWKGGEEGMTAEYGSLCAAKSVLGFTGRDGLLDFYRRGIAKGAALNPEYFVFHVSQCSLSQVAGGSPRYANGEVIDSAVQIINILSEEFPGQALLFENLWWSGLTLLESDLTKKLLDSVVYPNRGIVADTGHLLHLTPEPGPDSEGRETDMDASAEYILSVLEKQPDKDAILAMHLHGSRSASYRSAHSTPIPSGDWSADLAAATRYVHNLDCHIALESRLASDIVSAVSPEWLNLEFLSADRREHEDLIRRQLAFLGKTVNV